MEGPVKIHFVEFLRDDLTKCGLMARGRKITKEKEKVTCQFCLGKKRGR